jgi:hypothetical protein
MKKDRSYELLNNLGLVEERLPQTNSIGFDLAVTILGPERESVLYIVRELVGSLKEQT